MKRITLISGPIGSGKSSFSINYALQNAEKVNNLKFLDLDYLNVYFRSRTVRKMFEDKNIEMIGSSLNYNHQADLPAISGAIYTPLNDKDCTAIYDLAGAVSGLFVVKSFRDKIKNVDEVDFLVVINKFRLDSDDINVAIKFINDCEETLNLKVTGLISNGHMMEFTDDAIILENYEYVKELSVKTNIPIKYYVRQEKELVKDCESIKFDYMPMNS